MAKMTGNSVPDNAENNEVENDARHEADLDAEDMDYSELYDALEEISGYLDELEEKNQELHKELSNLLESNRQVRRELQNGIAS